MPPEGYVPDLTLTGEIDGLCRYGGRGFVGGGGWDMWGMLAGREGGWRCVWGVGGGGKGDVGQGGCDERSVAQDLNTAVGVKMLRVVRGGNARVGCEERFRFGGFGAFGA